MYKWDGRMNSWLLIFAVSFLLSSGALGADDWLPGQWTGTWNQTGGDPASGTLKITIEKKPDGTLGGRIQVEMNGSELYTADFKEVSQVENKMTIKYDYPLAPTEVQLKGEWREGSLAGTWEVSSADGSGNGTQGTWKATKP